MKERIVLSICIGTYNRKELLKQLIEEILKYPNWKNKKRALCRYF